MDAALDQSTLTPALELTDPVTVKDAVLMAPETWAALHLPALIASVIDAAEWLCNHGEPELAHDLALQFNAAARAVQKWQE